MKEYTILTVNPSKIYIDKADHLAALAEKETANEILRNMNKRFLRNMKSSDSR